MTVHTETLNAIRRAPIKVTARHLVLWAIAIGGLTEPAWAQSPYSPPSQPQQFAPAYRGSGDWRAAAPTPDDAYREGLINRWQLEQLRGPLPPALQGPTPNGEKGGEPSS